MLTRTIDKGRTLAAGIALALGLVLACLLGTAVQAQAAPASDDGAASGTEEVQATGRLVIEDPVEAVAPVPAEEAAVPAGGVPVDAPAAPASAPAPPAEESAAPVPAPTDGAATEPPAPTGGPAAEPVPDELAAAADVQATGRLVVEEPAASAADEPQTANAPTSSPTATTVPASVADEAAPLETFAAAPKSAWKQEPDGWHYYNAVGTTVKGMRKIDSRYYFFDSLGVMCSNDWVNVNGFWYYFQPVGSLSAKAPALVSGIKQLNSRRSSTVVYQNGRQVTKNFLVHDFYLFDAQGRMRTGLQKVGNQSYYFDSSGKMREGLVNVKGTLRRFVDTSVYGNSVAPMVTKLTRSAYYLTGTKAKATSVKRWLWYLSASTGEVYSGWKDIGGKRYYFSQGSMVSGLQVIDNKQYYFRGGLNTADGRAPLAKGMFRTISVVWDSSATVTPFYTWHYSKSDGTVASGWLKYGSQRYYLDQDGTMAIGYYAIDGKYYYFNEQNSERGGKSPLVTKLTQVKLRTYDSATKRYKTVYEWHNANADGTVKTGLLTVGGQKYCFAYYGLMLSGWQDVDGQRYYFKLDEKTGRAPALTNGIRVVKEQEWVSGSAYRLVSKKYYFDKSGANKAGWKQDAKKAWYYFGNAYTTGGSFAAPTSYGAAALTGGRYWVDGSYYTFDGTGKLVSPKKP